MKKALKVVIGIVVVIAVVLGAAWLMIDHLAKAGIERGGTYALGVPTRVDTVSLRLLKGELDLAGLTVANPEGYKTPHLLKTGRLDVAMRPASVLGDAIEVNRFELDGVDLHLEQKPGTSNVSVILDNIARLSGEKRGEAEGGTKVKVDRIVIRNVVAHIQVLPIGGEATTLTVKVPEIVLEGVTNDNAQGVAVSELVRRLVPAILAAVVDKGKGIIPDADLGRLGDSVAATSKALGAGAGKLVQQVGGRAAEALQGLGTTVKGAGEKIKEGVGGALEGLLGGKKKGEEKPD
jgi:hypothetical protein